MFSVATAPKKGTATVTSEGVFTYTPNVDTDGGDGFTIQVSDGSLAVTKDVFVAVNPTDDNNQNNEDKNSAPIVSTDILSYSTTPEEPILDSITAVDPDGDELFYTIIVDPSQGTVDITSDGSFTYTPQVNAEGIDNFTINISDGDLSVSKEVVVNVLPDTDIEDRDDVDGAITLDFSELDNGHILLNMYVDATSKVESLDFTLDWNILDVDYVSSKFIPGWTF